MPLPANLEATEFDLWLRFESNNVIDVEHLANFFREISRLARTQAFYGSEATVTLRRLQSDSPTTIWVQVLDGAGNLAGIGQLGIGILMLVKERKAHRLSKALAVIMTDDDVYELDTLFRDPSGNGARRLTVSREEIPAVGALIQKREAGTERPLFLGDQLTGVPDALPAPAFKIGWTPASRSSEGAVPRSTAQRSLALQGHFVKVAGERSAVFETGDSVLEVQTTSKVKFDDLPFDRPVTATGIVDGDIIFVIGWTFGGKVA